MLPRGRNRSRRGRKGASPTRSSPSSATSLLPGSSGNTSPGVFSRHNFTGYTQSAYGGLLVTNTYGITGGRDTEDDDSYRYRIHLKLTSQSGINEAALRFQLLQLPGIQDVVFSSYAGGFYVYLYGISPIISPSLLQLANSTIATTAAFPIQGTALTPDLVGISLETTLSFGSGTAASDQASILSTAGRRGGELYQQPTRQFTARHQPAGERHSRLRQSHPRCRRSERRDSSFALQVAILRC